MATGGYDLGTARGRIDIDTGSAERNLTNVARKQGILEKSSGSSAQALRGTGIALAGIGGLAIAGFGLAINTAAGFEKRISAIGAVSGATKGELDQLRKKALQLGADTSFSAGEAASAMEELSKAGISVTDILGGAADATVALAAAGEIDLPQAATIAANAMNQFNIPASKMAHVADLIAGAANASAIDVSDFGNSIQQAGAIANIVGLTFDDTALAITAMGNAGIKGSDAGTSLKTFLTNLQPTTKKSSDLMEELGIITDEAGNRFFDAQGHVKSMAEISDVLQGSLKGMTDAQKTATLNTLFGTDAIRAAAIITKEGSKGFNELADKMDKVKAADVAKARLDNLDGSIEQLKGSMETLVIQIGTPFLAAIRVIVDKFTGWINVLSGLNPQLQKFIAIGVLAVAMLVGLSGVIFLFISYLSKLKETLDLLKLTTLLTNPAVLALVAVAALAAGLFLLYKHSKTARDIMDGIFEFFQPAIQAVVGFVQNFVKQVQILINVFKAGKGSVDQVAQAIDRAFGGTGKVAPVINGIVRALVGFWGWINKTVDALGGWKRVLTIAAIALAVLMAPIPALIAGLVLAYQRSKLFRDIINTIGRVLVGAGKFIVGFALAVVNMSKEIFNWLNKNVFPTFFAFGELVAAVVNRIISVIHFLTPLFRLEFNSIATIVRAAFIVLQTVVQNAMIAISAVIRIVLGAIQIFWNNFGSIIIGVIQNVFGVIKTVVETFMGIIRGILQVLTGLISGDWSKAWEGIRTIFNSVWNGIKQIVKLAIESVKLTISAVLATIKTLWQVAWNTILIFLSSVWATIKNLVGGAFEAVKGVVSGGVNAIVGFVGSLPSRVLGALKSFVTLLADKGDQLIRGLFRGILDAWNTVWSWLTGLPDAVIKAVLGLADSLLDMGRKVINGLWNGMKDVWDDVTGWLSNLNPGSWFNDINVQKHHAEKNLLHMGELVMGGLQQGMQSGWDDTTKWLRSIDPSMFVSPIAPSLAGVGSGGDNLSFTFEFGDLTSPEAASAVKETLMSPEVLQGILQAVKAGRSN